MQKENKNCILCPRKCGINRAEKTGYCGAGEEPEVALYMLHHYEEPFISGEPDDKRGSGTVFFKHCGLKCVYCQNYKISGVIKKNAAAAKKESAAESLADIFLKLQQQGAYNINLVTPTHYTGKIIDAVKAAKENGHEIPVIWNTSGYELPETVARLDGTVDIYLTDFKYFDGGVAERYSLASDYFETAAAALDVMVKQRPRLVFDKDGMLVSGVVVRHMTLPGYLSDSCKVIEYLYRKYGDNICISIMSQYTPQKGCDYTKYPELQDKVTRLQYKRLVKYAESLGVKNAFIQGGAAVSESFTPDFDEE